MLNVPRFRRCRGSYPLRSSLRANEVSITFSEITGELGCKVYQVGLSASHFLLGFARVLSLTFNDLRIKWIQITSSLKKLIQARCWFCFEPEIGFLVWNSAVVDIGSYCSTTFIFRTAYDFQMLKIIFSLLLAKHAKWNLCISIWIPSQPQWLSWLSLPTCWPIPCHNKLTVPFPASCDHCWSQQRWHNQRGHYSSISHLSSQWQTEMADEGGNGWCPGRA